MNTRIGLDPGEVLGILLQAIKHTIYYWTLPYTTRYYHILPGITTHTTRSYHTLPDITAHYQILPYITTHYLTLPDLTTYYQTL